jgi:glucose-1-phosphate thymidylyltransferase
MRAIILAAGYATRLEASAKGTVMEKIFAKAPKALVEVGGRSLLAYLMDELTAADVSIVTNSRYYPIFKDWLANSGYKVRLIDNGTSSNETKLGAVKDFELGLKGGKGDVFLAASDVLLPHFSLPGFYRAFSRNGDSVLAATMSEEKIRGRYGNLQVDGKGVVKAFVEKPEKPISNLVSVPYYMLKQQTADKVKAYLAEGNPSDPIGKFVGWLAGRVPLHCEIVKEPYFDVGTYDDWKTADAWLRGNPRGGSR